MILNQAQAEAVYSAMCALNNVSAKVKVNLPIGGGLGIRVNENLGVIYITGEGWCSGRETYSNQAEFATAYKLC